MLYRDIRQYRDELRKQARAFKRRAFDVEAYKIDVRDGPRKGIYAVYADNFAIGDGGVLKFYEYVEFRDGEVHKIEYSYGFTRGDYYFRYEKDPDRERGYEHPLLHLHSNADEPRYMTHETNFEEVLSFILAQFY